MYILRLIPYELKKLFSAKFIYLFLAGLLVANVFLCSFLAKDPVTDETLVELPKLGEYVDKVYDMYLEDPEFVLSEYDRIMALPKHTSFSYGDKGYPDEAIFEHFYKIVGKDEFYHKRVSKMVLQAEMMCSNLEYLGNTEGNYLYYYNAQIAERYAELNESVKIDGKKVSGWSAYFTYDTEIFAVIGAVTLLVVSMAVSDHKSGFAAIADTCRYGRKESAVARYIAVILVSALVTLLFALSSLVTVGFRIGFSEIGNAVQAVPELELFPFDLTIGGAVALLWLFKIVAVSLYGIVLFTLCSFVKSYIFGFGVGAGMLALSYFLSTLDTAVYGQWIMLNPISIHSPGGIFTRFRTVNLFGYSLDIYIALTAIGFVLLALGGYLACMLSSARKPKIHRRKRLDVRYYLHFAQNKLLSYLPRRKVRRGSLSLGFYEVFKSRFLYVVLIFLIVIKMFSASNYYKKAESTRDSLTKEYIAEIEGPYNTDKMAYLEEQMYELNMLLMKESEMHTAFQNGEISFQEYTDYLKQYESVQYRKQVLQSIVSYGEYLGTKYAQTGARGSFVYDTGYLKFASQGVDWILLLFLVIFCSRFYLVEHERRNTESPMYVILQTTGRGRKELFWRKLILNLVITASVFVLFRAIDVYYLLQNYSLPDLSAKLFSITRFSLAPASMSILGYTVFTTLLSFVGVLLLSMLIFLSAIRLKKTILTYAVLSAGLFIPHFIVQTSGWLGNYIDLTQLYDTHRLYLYSVHHSPSLYIFFFAILCAGIIALLYSSLRKIQKGGKV